MKHLYLLRHAKSKWKGRGISDFERPLKKRGIEACAVLAAYMQGRGIVPDLVICSSARRARDTLALISRHLGREFASEYREALYLATAAELLKEVRSVDDAVMSLMVVGHNPGLADLARGLVGGGEPDALRALAGKVPTGALASLEMEDGNWTDLGPGGAHLAAYTTPRELA